MGLLHHDESTKQLLTHRNDRRAAKPQRDLLLHSRCTTSCGRRRVGCTATIRLSRNNLAARSCVHVPIQRFRRPSGTASRSGSRALYRVSISCLTFASIKFRTPRNWSGVISLGSGICQSTRCFARTSGHSSPQPIVTAKSTSLPLKSSSPFGSVARILPFVEHKLCQ
jgi:hypothetical protein